MPASEISGRKGIIMDKAEIIDYPVQLSIDYQESSNRLSVLLRIILVIPIMLVLGNRNRCSNPNARSGV